jgi:O-antigen ligase
VAAIFTSRFSRANQLTLAFVAVVGLYIAFAWLRSRYLLHLTPVQLDYGTSKTLYFILVVLPMAAAVAMMVDRAEDAWPAAAVQLLMGVVVSVATVALLWAHFLGESGYTSQGNLIALGAVLAVQPWLFRKIWVSAAIGVLSVAAIMYAEARQSLAGFVLVLLLIAVYWGVAGFRLMKPGTRRRVLSAIVTPYAVLPLALVAMTGAWIAVTYHPSRACNCVTDRIIKLESNAGDRDLLLQRGIHLFEESPILGTGLGSFAGVIPNQLNPSELYQYPHNVPLEIASETGLVGFVLIIVPLLVAWAFLLWKGVTLASPAIGGVMTLVAVFFVIANVSGDIPSERGMWIFGILALKLGLTFVRSSESTAARGERLETHAAAS